MLPGELMRPKRAAGNESGANRIVATVQLLDGN